MTKIISVFTILAIPLGMASCGSSAGKPTQNADASSASVDGNSRGDNSLSYTVNGRNASIKDYLEKDGKNIIALFINDVITDDGSGMVRIQLTNELTKEVFDLKVNNKGTTSLTHATASLLNGKYVGTYMSPKYRNYYADSVTVTIDALSATRVSGTFSGRFRQDPSEGNEAAEFTDGRFDVAIPSHK